MKIFDMQKKSGWNEFFFSFCLLLIFGEAFKNFTEIKKDLSGKIILLII